MTRDEIISAIDKKYREQGVPTETMLEGLLYSESMTYWDYIQTDALLGLQIKRTNQPDEMVFIMYHQINELLFKMILWEIDQVAQDENPGIEKFKKHLNRVSRYFDMLSESFNIMGDGMDVDQYMKFRNTLAPASGFQSAQYRKVEFASTELINLIDNRFRETIDRNTPFKHAFDHLYWQAAGKNYETGQKSALLRNFENKYMGDFIDFMTDYNECNLAKKFKALPKEAREDIGLLNTMRHYDHTVNVKWVMAHYNAAGKYLNTGKDAAEATGGSDWQKYMHPRYQKRIFYPELWSDEEKKNWGVDNLEGYKLLENPKTN
ncbi:MAG: tryptophan 2,3-dioxygenase family protein [Vicingaceae bacterium]